MIGYRLLFTLGHCGLYHIMMTQNRHVFSSDVELLAVLRPKDGAEKAAGSIPAASTYDIHRQTVTFGDNPCHRKGFLLRLPKARSRHQMTQFDKPGRL